MTISKFYFLKGANLRRGEIEIGVALKIMFFLFSSDTPHPKSLLLMLTIKQLVNLDPMGPCTSDKGSVMRVHQSSIRKRNFIKVY